MRSDLYFIAEGELYLDPETFGGPVLVMVVRSNREGEDFSVRLVAQRFGEDEGPCFPLTADELRRASKQAGPSPAARMACEQAIKGVRAAVAVRSSEELGRVLSHIIGGDFKWEKLPVA